MLDISSFMKSRGYANHSGKLDQTVINELADYMGSNRVPVYAGGFYEAMNSIMINGSTGSMNKIVSNLRDDIPHVTTGARWVQTVLKALGYYSGTVDGKYGEGTTAAVNRFQKEHSFEERDYVTLGVARCMLEEYYYSGYDIGVLP